jgi:hypothetical protein
LFTFKVRNKRADIAELIRNLAVSQNPGKELKFLELQFHSDSGGGLVGGGGGGDMDEEGEEEDEEVEDVEMEGAGRGLVQQRHHHHQLQQQHPHHVMGHQVAHQIKVSPHYISPLQNLGIKECYEIFVSVFRIPEILFRLPVRILGSDPCTLCTEITVSGSSHCTICLVTIETRYNVMSYSTVLSILINAPKGKFIFDYRYV